MTKGGFGKPSEWQIKTKGLKSFRTYRSLDSDHKVHHN